MIISPFVCNFQNISGNVDTNPGTGHGPRYDRLLKFMHGNVNSLSTHDFIRIPFDTVIKFI